MNWILLGLVLTSIEISRGVLVRLKGGKHLYEGRIEVLYNGTWKAVCDHGWERNGARVVCRMLGFPDVLRYTKGYHAFGVGKPGKFWLDDVRCSGEEDSIDKCSHRPWGRHNCQYYNQAGAVCRRRLSNLIVEPKPSQASGQISKVNIRLKGPVVDDYISEGVVLVEHEGKWGYICPSKWTQSNSYVLCGQLGFPAAKTPTTHTETIQDVEPVYWLDQVTCKGWEGSIVSCDHTGWGRHQCEDGGAVRIECVRRLLRKPLDVRLRSGALVSEGRVEIQHSRYWGTICDDHWTIREANVVCRSMGYGTATMASRNAYYGRGIGKIMLDDVYCVGNEKSIKQCKKSRWQKSNCDHHEDAGVRCNVPSLQGHEVRIRGGANHLEGRVEVFHDGKWGTVCADGWGIEEAMIVCRQLNLGFASDAITNQTFSQTDLEVIMSGVQCHVNDISIYNCEHDEWTNTTCSDKKKSAGVACVSALPDLVVNTDILRRNMELNVFPLSMLRCAMEENCLSPSAAYYLRYSDTYQRRLLRFSVQVENRGLDHFRPKADKSTWQWHKCHQHYHSMETFSSYDLLRQTSGKKVSEGHKASFCLEDTKCDSGFDKVWNCTDMGDQGISPGCYDIYYYNIDCQWVDCTDFVHGAFYLRVHINPGNQVAESDFKNNVAKCSVYDYGTYVLAHRCWLEDCESGLDTHGGNSGGNCCVLPFLYKGKLYHDCTTDGYIKKWCSTTYDFRKDKKWGICYD
ncbi:Lysyl oxidase-like 2 [Stylophora pistillata]|uniref:protein-lysine 6-oxidase n=3 Tax=Stylophora pistillata TaxID=50429 RepID=A0A2B4SLM2_STYPI|nr:Lysyl oxidase-like 2 [Stylophora pistillata]